MRGLLFRRKNTEDNRQLDKLLQRAQAGDEDARNALIETYSPFGYALPRRPRGGTLNGDGMSSTVWLCLR